MHLVWEAISYQKIFASALIDIESRERLQANLALRKVFRDLNEMLRVAA